MPRPTAIAGLQPMTFRNQSRPFSFTTRLRDGPSPSYQPPSPPSSTPVNPHRNFYKSFGRPIAKVFFGAMATYQILYWGWLKLESIEERVVKDEEVRSLEAKLAGITGSQRREG